MTRTTLTIAAAMLTLATGCWRSHQRAPIDADVPDDVRWPDDAWAPADAFSLPDAGRDAPLFDVGTIDCSERGGPLVTLPGDPPYQMEIHEVTQREYARFLACETAPQVIAPCRGVDVIPVATLDPFTLGDVPVEGVSFCAAAAYCAWAGRRLCTHDEWFPACRAVTDAVAWESARGPYMADEGACNLSGYGDGVWELSPDDRVRAVGEATRCRAETEPYAQLLDVIGNVWEPVMTPDATEDWVAHAGGDYSSGPYDPCVNLGRTSAGAQVHGQGIRCCADGT